MEEIIANKLNSALAPLHLQIINESHMHAGPATDSHFNLVVVSDHFAGLSPVKRHQLLYRVLAEELQGPVHALALHTFTPAEWQAGKGIFAASPKCSGAKK
ncbi:MAG: BolA family protein [Pseudohongiellaceae bacterium]